MVSGRRREDKGFPKECQHVEREKEPTHLDGTSSHRPGSTLNYLAGGSLRRRPHSHTCAYTHPGAHGSGDGDHRTHRDSGANVYDQPGTRGHDDSYGDTHANANAHARTHASAHALSHAYSGPLHRDPASYRHAGSYRYSCSCAHAYAYAYAYANRQ